MVCPFSLLHFFKYLPLITVLGREKVAGGKQASSLLMSVVILVGPYNAVTGVKVDLDVLPHHVLT